MKIPLLINSNNYAHPLAQSKGRKILLGTNVTQMYPSYYNYAVSHTTNGKHVLQKLLQCPVIYYGLKGFLEPCVLYSLFFIC